MIIQAGIVRIVFNQNYDSVLSKQMLAMTNIEIVQLDPESGDSKPIKLRHASTDLLSLQQ
jgi:deoxycytidylate deaminase